MPTGGLYNKGTKYHEVQPEGLGNMYLQQSPCRDALTITVHTMIKRLTFVAANTKEQIST